MGDKSFTNNTSSDSLLNESLEEASNLRNQVVKLTSSNEEYQQTIHVLRRELESTKAMNQEIKYLYEEASAQRTDSLNTEIQKLTNKFNEERKYFQSRIKEIEDDLHSKVDEIQILKSENVDLKKQEKLVLPTIEEETIYEETTEHNDSKVKELMNILEDRDNNFIELETINSSLQNQVSNLQTIIEDFRTRLHEKEEIIENTQEELANCRIELNSLKQAPLNDHQKGNSLFAEVEDRRQNMMEKMKSMRVSHIQMQRSFQAKENEIKSLKMEKAKLIREYEESCLETADQEEALVDAYRKRIRDLENALKEEQKKTKEFQKEQEMSSNMNYLQTLLKSKKKEIEELQTQIENNSIRTLLKEEFSYKIKNRLRYWKYSALSLEANLSEIKNRCQENLNHSTSGIQEILKTKKNQKSLKVDDEFEDEPESSLQRELIDETNFTLENLIQSIQSINNLTEMSLTDATNDSCIDLDSTVILNSNKEKSNTISKTLNFTKDMSITQPIDRDDIQSMSKISKTLNYTEDMSITQPIDTSNLKIEINDDIEDFQPVSTSSSLDNIQQKMNHISLANKESNKENIQNIVGNSTILKSALSKSMKYSKEPKEKKVLQFSDDTREPQSSYVRQLKAKQMNYPIVYISSDSHK